MGRYILQRLLIAIPTLLGVTLILFVLASKMPGNAVLALITPDTPQSADLIKIRQGQLGLDQPLPVQYARWIGQLAQGKLGFSYINGHPISEQIAERVPATLELMLVALLLSVVIGVTLGVISALRRYSVLDYLLTVSGFVGLSVPVFFLGMVLVYVFALRLQWFPTSGLDSVGGRFSLRENLHHLVLPTLTLACVRVPLFMRYTRASLLEVLGNDYMRTARAKGLTERVVLWRHAMRNALIPVITVVGLTLPVLFGGAIIVETVYQWPGIGLLFINAVNQRDIPMLMGVATISAVLVLASNLLTDIAYALVDPRITY